MVFAADLSSWLGFDLDLDKIKTEVKWKDFGNGSRMGKIHRDGDAGAVLYHVAADADPECFQPHTHTGGEMYLVLEGEVYDENGTFPKGSLVWMDAGSRHTPKCRGETYILTLWPGGVTG